MTSPTTTILTIPEASIDRPSGALIALQWVMLTHCASGQGVALAHEEVATICEALGEIIPAVQTLEAVTATRIDEAEAIRPSADVVFLRPRHRNVATPTGGDAA